MEKSLINKCTLKDNTSIKDAIRNLVKTSQKIIFVIDKLNNFIGTVADGDIRRGLINGSTLNDTIDTVMNKRPVSTTKNLNSDEVEKIMVRKDISHIPILNKKKNNFCIFL